MKMWNLMLVVMSLGIPIVAAAENSPDVSDVVAKVDVCKPCPLSGWTRAGPYCAKYFQHKVTYDQAVKNCRAQCDSCRLISIHDAATDQAVKALTAPGYAHAWIGASRLPGGEYKWTDGTEWDYQNWAPGEPKENGHCVNINWPSPGYWDNIHCHGTLFYICGVYMCD